MTLRTLFAALTLSLAACQGAPLAKEALWSQLQEQPLAFDTEEVPRPSTSGPLRVGIAPPVRPSNAWSGSPYRHSFGYDIWTDGERDVLTATTDRLRATGLVSHVQLLPAMLVEESHQDREQPVVDLSALQRAGRRLGLDAIVVVRGADSYGERANPLALLDLTIIGAFLIPGHKYEGNAVLEAVAIDVHTGFVYASASADGNYTKTRPVALAEREDVVEPARMEALEELGERLSQQLLGL